MKLAIGLTILLLFLDILLGSQAFGYGIFLIYALVFIISLIIGIIVSARILVVLKSQKKEISPLLHIFIVPLFIIISMPLAYFTSIVVNNINNDRRDAQESIQTKRQDFNSIKRGSIVDTGSAFTYECEQCGYKIKFPSTWGFGEDDLSSSYGGLRQMFRLVTADYQISSTKPKGAIFYIDSAKNSQMDTTLSIYIKDINSGPSWSKPFNYIESKRTIGDYIVTMNVSHISPYYEGYIRFFDKGNYYIITVVYGDENSFNGSLNVLLNNFQSIE